MATDYLFILLIYYFVIDRVAQKANSLILLPVRHWKVLTEGTKPSYVVSLKARVVTYKLW